jgi:hypothetical protein
MRANRMAARLFLQKPVIHFRQWQSSRIWRPFLFRTFSYHSDQRPVSSRGKVYCSGGAGLGGTWTAFGAGGAKAKIF